MKRNIQEIVLALLLGVLMPWITLEAASELITRDMTVPAQTSPISTITPVRTVPVLLSDGSVVDMELDAYLAGVLLREMPGSFDMEAKKAQAVVARTYALRTAGKAAKHPPGAVCTDSACCQGYYDPQEYLADGGSRENIELARLAVAATRDQILTYNGALIEATYFSCSGGMTEDAVAVWGSEIPYLQAVSSPGEEHAAHYTDTVSFTADAFRQALGQALPGSPQSWFGEVTYTDGGGVDTLSICGTLYKGTTLRSLLSLRSTAFEITTTADSVTVTTRGFGHRVGMSQYGADAMARRGCTYAEILSHYYPGAEIDKAEVLG